MTTVFFRPVRPSRFTRFRVLFCIVIGLLSAPCWAQQGRFGIGYQQNMSRFIPPPRLLNQQLREAEDAIGDQRYSDAVVILGDLLERNVDPDDDLSIAGQDFFLDILDNDQQRLKESFLRRCRALIGQLPSAGREIYQVRYGALAKQLLDSATADRDWGKLREVRRRYFHTDAGYQASLLLAQHELHRGHPLAASLLLDDVVDSPQAVQLLGVEVFAIHGIACRLGGRSIPRELLSAEYKIAVGPNGEPEQVSDWRTWIDQNFQVPPSDSVSRSRDYPLLGASVTRNDTMEGQLPLSTPRWMLETTATPLEEQTLRRKAEELAASGRLVPPSWTPLRIGNQLLMRTTERLRGVDHRTGKRVWQYPWFQSDERLENDDMEGFGRGPTNPTERLGRRVWNDVPYGQITSDGERVFLLDDLSPFQVLQINPLMGVRNTSSADGGRNTLVALELATEGKTLWRLGQDPTVESVLNEAFFLGAPIAVDGSLYTMVELAGDILLVCLDPATGKLRWQQQLVAIEGAGIQFDAIRRIAGATPSYHEGVLICPTGAGSTVAVDLGDRTLRWGNSYQRRASGNIMFNRSRTSQSSDELLERWHNAAAITNGTAVVVTPVATDNLFCYELVDGEKRFSKSRQAAFYAAGIRGDRLLMVGAREVVSYEMDRGRLEWRTDPRLLSAGQQITGLGVFGPDSYIVPTSSNELIELSLADGSELGRQSTQFPLGNLIAVDGEIISQSPTRLAVAFGTRTLGPRVERMLQEDPDNLDALIQKALLLSERGERSEALDVLEKARRIDPESDDVLMLSINSMLGELRDNPSPPEGLEEQLDALIDTPAQRLEFLSLRIQSALRNEAVEDATKRLLEFSSVLANVSPMGNEDDSILRDPARDCKLDSWMAARAAEIVQMAERQDRLSSVREQASAFAESKRLGSSKSLSAITSQLRPLGIDVLLDELADRKTAEGDLFSAERLLIGPARPSQILNQGEPIGSRSNALKLAKVYQQGSLPEDALAVVKTLSGEQDAQADEALQALQGEIKQNLEWSQRNVDVDLPVKLSWQSQAIPGTARNSYMQTIVHPSLEGGQSFQGSRVVNVSGSVILQDAYGRSLPLPMDEFRAASRSQDRQAKISGGLLLLERPGRVSAIDLFAMQSNRRRDALLWTRDFGAEGDIVSQRKTEPTPFGDIRFSYPANSNAANVNSEFRVGPSLGDRLLVLQTGDLIAIDTSTSETLWRNSKAPQIGHLLADDHTVAVVSHKNGLISSVTKFDLLDGRKLESSDWAYGDVWTTSGQHVLAYELDAKSSVGTIRLIDPFTDTIVLETELPVKQPLVQDVGRGMGRVLQDRYLVLFDSTGELVIWDLMGGTELCRQQTGEMPSLQSMQAMWMNDQILVLPANAVVRSKGDMLTQHGESHRTVHKVISVATDSGEIKWSRDFEEPWGITVDQPAAAPAVVLARSRTTYTINGSKPKMDIALLRLSDGEIIHETLEREVSPQSTGLTTYLSCHPDENQIRARIDGELMTFNFGDATEDGQPRG